MKRKSTSKKIKKQKETETKLLVKQRLTVQMFTLPPGGNNEKRAQTGKGTTFGCV